MQAIYVPSIPPASPYEAYLLLLVIPFFFRMVMVIPPCLISSLNLVMQMVHCTDSRNSCQRIGPAHLNEILALLLPFLLAVYARTKFDPVGWPDWNTTPDMAFWLLVAFAVLWLYVDLLRVARTSEVGEQNRFIAKAAVHVAAKTRGVLDYLQACSRPWICTGTHVDDIMEGRDPKEPQMNFPSHESVEC